MYTVTKDIALTAAKFEAQLKNITTQDLAKRDPKKPETEEQKLERICENRRRKWDCFHLATAQVLGCQVLYSTDNNLQKRATSAWARRFEGFTARRATSISQRPIGKGS